jgi:L-fuconolactonase
VSRYPVRIWNKHSSPVDKGFYGYAAFWNACKVLTRAAGVAEKADLFSRTAARFYRLDLAS